MEKNCISTAELNSGEYVAISIVEITSIPHKNIIPCDSPQESAEEVNRDNAKVMLDSVYQVFKESGISGDCSDISLEILWKSETVKNQSFSAKIRIYLVVRTIHYDSRQAMITAEKVMATMQFGFRRHKFSFREITQSELEKLLITVPCERVIALEKEERIEDLQNQIMPYCFTYDKIPESCNDFSYIIDVLKSYPDCILSFQLIPTNYSAEERGALGNILQSLSVLGQGLFNPQVGNVKFLSAEEPLSLYKYYLQNQSSSLFLYNIVIYGNGNAVEHLAQSVTGHLSNNKNERKTNFKSAALDFECADMKGNFYPLPWAINETVLYDAACAGAARFFVNANEVYRLPLIITAEEAAEFFRMPIGNENVTAGIAINEADMVTKPYAEKVLNEYDIEAGALKNNAGNKLGVQLNDLTKHMLITGTPGSGKTTYAINMLNHLWKEKKIPFLVIEPAKSEYRGLLDVIPELQVFTPGKSYLSPLQLNPFVPPTNVRLESYKATLKTAFEAAVAMPSPLDQIFEEGINYCYSKFRWLNHYTVEDGGEIFNIEDYIKCFEEIFEKIGYTGDAKNIERAGLVRLNSLRGLFDNYNTIPIEDLLRKPTVIELSALENTSQKVLVIALILLSILAYVNNNYLGDGKLKNLVLLEEAHVLFDAQSGMLPDSNQSVNIAKDLLKRMLAEIRSYGIGIVVADQSPRKVTEDVVALTDIKMAFRLVEEKDRSILANSTNMSEHQKQRLAKLHPGEAYFFFGKLEEPEEIITENYREENNIRITISDDEVKALSLYWADKRNQLKPYPQCDYVHCCRDECDYECRLFSKEIANRIFIKQFNRESKDFEQLKMVFGQIKRMIETEMGGVPGNEKCIPCVKVHFLRMIKYRTRIPITDKVIQLTLEKA